MYSDHYNWCRLLILIFVCSYRFIDTGLYEDSPLSIYLHRSSFKDSFMASMAMSLLLLIGICWKWTKPTVAVHLRNTFWHCYLVLPRLTPLRWAAWGLPFSLCSICSSTSWQSLRWKLFIFRTENQRETFMKVIAKMRVTLRVFEGHKKVGLIRT